MTIIISSCYNMLCKVSLTQDIQQRGHEVHVQKIKAVRDSLVECGIARSWVRHLKLCRR